ncbi:hypothetical protein TRFO_35854 [Tritrichomonas foetus]|uniref:C2 domain-containing protein n=1 Tax=Tritrichomonas foetus TaxID=1144522 RepID=A0A1J4JGS1_9EUKA|nr:hypothetical protein TRFO_35854 [Tritrichomonas foetus]|eukprot:OHS97865.1 hypothetical protein TRFO_35854 [Tritrichomonas foetus]
MNRRKKSKSNPKKQDFFDRRTIYHLEAKYLSSVVQTIRENQKSKALPDHLPDQTVSEKLASIIVVQYLFQHRLDLSRNSFLNEFNSTMNISRSDLNSLPKKALKLTGKSSYIHELLETVNSVNNRNYHHPKLAKALMVKVPHLLSDDTKAHFTNILDKAANRKIKNNTNENQKIVKYSDDEYEEDSESYESISQPSDLNEENVLNRQETDSDSLSSPSQSFNNADEIFNFSPPEKGVISNHKIHKNGKNNKNNQPTHRYRKDYIAQLESRTSQVILKQDGQVVVANESLIESDLETKSNSKSKSKAKKSKPQKERIIVDESVKPTRLAEISQQKKALKKMMKNNQIQDTNDTFQINNDKFSKSSKSSSIKSKNDRNENEIVKREVKFEAELIKSQEKSHKHTKKPKRRVHNPEPRVEKVSRTAVLLPDGMYEKLSSSDDEYITVESTYTTTNTISGEYDTIEMPKQVVLKAPKSAPIVSPVDNSQSDNESDKENYSSSDSSEIETGIGLSPRNPLIKSNSQQNSKKNEIEEEDEYEYVTIEEEEEEEFENDNIKERNIKNKYNNDVEEFEYEYITADEEEEIYEFVEEEEEENETQSESSIPMLPRDSEEKSEYDIVYEEEEDYEEEDFEEEDFEEEEEVEELHEGNIPTETETESTDSIRHISNSTIKSSDSSSNKNQKKLLVFSGSNAVEYISKNDKQQILSPKTSSIQSQLNIIVDDKNVSPRTKSKFEKNSNDIGIHDSVDVDNAFQSSQLSSIEKSEEESSSVSIFDKYVFSDKQEMESEYSENDSVDNKLKLTNENESSQHNESSFGFNDVKSPKSQRSENNINATLNNLINSKKLIRDSFSDELEYEYSEEEEEKDNQKLINRKANIIDNEEETSPSPKSQEFTSDKYKEQNDKLESSDNEKENVNNESSSSSALINTPYEHVSPPTNKQSSPSQELSSSTISPTEQEQPSSYSSSKQETTATATTNTTATTSTSKSEENYSSNQTIESSSTSKSKETSSSNDHNNSSSESSDSENDEHVSSSSTSVADRQYPTNLLEQVVQHFSPRKDKSILSSTTTNEYSSENERNNEENCDEANNKSRNELSKKSSSNTSSKRKKEYSSDESSEPDHDTYSYTKDSTDSEDNLRKRHSSTSKYRNSSSTKGNKSSSRTSKTSKYSKSSPSRSSSRKTSSSRKLRKNDSSSSDYYYSTTESSDDDHRRNNRRIHKKQSSDDDNYTYDYSTINEKSKTKDKDDNTYTYDYYTYETIEQPKNTINALQNRNPYVATVNNTNKNQNKEPIDDEYTYLYETYETKEPNKEMTKWKDGTYDYYTYETIENPKLQNIEQQTTPKRSLRIRVKETPNGLVILDDKNNESPIVFASQQQLAESINQQINFIKSQEPKNPEPAEENKPKENGVVERTVEVEPKRSKFKISREFAEFRKMNRANQAKKKELETKEDSDYPHIIESGPHAGLIKRRIKKADRELIHQQRLMKQLQIGKIDCGIEISSSSLERNAGHPIRPRSAKTFRKKGLRSGRRTSRGRKGKQISRKAQEEANTRKKSPIKQFYDEDGNPVLVQMEDAHGRPVFRRISSRNSRNQLSQKHQSSPPIHLAKKILTKTNLIQKKPPQSTKPQRTKVTNNNKVNQKIMRPELTYENEYTFEYETEYIKKNAAKEIDKLLGDIDDNSDDIQDNKLNNKFKNRFDENEEEDDDFDEYDDEKYGQQHEEMEFGKPFRSRSAPHLMDNQFKNRKIYLKPRESSTISTTLNSSSSSDVDDENPFREKRKEESSNNATSFNIDDMTSMEKRKKRKNIEKELKILKQQLLASTSQSIVNDQDENESENDEVFDEYDYKHSSKPSSSNNHQNDLTSKASSRSSTRKHVVQDTNKNKFGQHEPPRRNSTVPQQLNLDFMPLQRDVSELSNSSSLFERRNIPKITVAIPAKGDDGQADVFRKHYESLSSNDTGDFDPQDEAYNASPPVMDNEFNNGNNNEDFDDNPFADEEEEIVEIQKPQISPKKRIKKRVKVSLRDGSRSPAPHEQPKHSNPKLPNEIVGLPKPVKNEVENEIEDFKTDSEPELNQMVERGAIIDQFKDESSDSSDSENEENDLNDNGNLTDKSDGASSIAIGSMSPAQAIRYEANKKTSPSKLKVPSPKIDHGTPKQAQRILSHRILDSPPPQNQQPKIKIPLNTPPSPKNQDAEVVVRNGKRKIRRKVPTNGKRHQGSSSTSSNKRRRNVIRSHHLKDEEKYPVDSPTPSVLSATNTSEYESDHSLNEEEDIEKIRIVVSDIKPTSHSSETKKSNASLGDFLKDISSPSSDDEAIENQLDNQINNKQLSLKDKKMVKSSSSSNSKIINKYSVQITVVEASGLPKIDDFDDCDPYCLLFIEGSTSAKRTKSMKATSTPVWNETFDFSVTDASPYLCIQLKDTDIVAGDEILSSTKINLIDVIPNNIKEEPFDVWYNLNAENEDEEGGKVHLLITRKLIGSEANLTISNNSSSTTTTSNFYFEQNFNSKSPLKKHMPALQLNLLVDQGKDMPKTNSPFFIVAKIKTNSNNHSDDHQSKLSPISTEKVCKTKPLISTTPNWKQNFVLKLFEPATDILQIILRNRDEKNGDDDVAFASLPISSMPLGQTIDKWVELKSLNDKIIGSIRLILKTEVDVAAVELLKKNEKEKKQQFYEKQKAMNLSCSSEKPRVELNILCAKRVITTGCYCIIRLEGKNEASRTRTVQDTFNQIWNEKFNFWLSDLNNDKLLIKIRSDENDETIGEVSIPLNNLQLGKPLKEWYKLSPSGSGKIRVQLSLEMPNSVETSMSLPFIYDRNTPSATPSALKVPGSPFNEIGADPVTVVTVGFIELNAKKYLINKNFIGIVKFAKDESSKRQTDASTNLKWNQFRELATKSMNAVLQIEIFEESTNNESNNEEFGYIEIPLKSLKMGVNDRWFKLSNNEEIHLNINMNKIETHPSIDDEKVILVDVSSNSSEFESMESTNSESEAIEKILNMNFQNNQNSHPNQMNQKKKSHSSQSSPKKKREKNKKNVLTTSKKSRIKKDEKPFSFDKKRPPNKQK